MRFHVFAGSLTVGYSPGLFMKYVEATRTDGFKLRVRFRGVAGQRIPG